MFSGKLWKVEKALVKTLLQFHIKLMSFIVIALLFSGALIGFLMGWGTLSRKLGCAVLCATPVLMLAMIIVEPMVTGVRQSSSAGLAIPFGSLLVGLSAAVGGIVGAIAYRIAKR